MAEISSSRIVITVLGKNRPGIVAGVTRVLGEANVDIRDITQSIIEDIFTMTMLADTAESKLDFAELQKALAGGRRAFGRQRVHPARGRLQLYVPPVASKPLGIA